VKCPFCKEFISYKFNTKGTLNFQPRVHKFDILFTPQPSATVANPTGNNLFFTYKETVRFFGLNGMPCTGLDVDGTRPISFLGFPDLPVAFILETDLAIRGLEVAGSQLILKG
jgi:hypothetical protein